jgi:hypothetical protein
LIKYKKARRIVMGYGTMRAIMMSITISYDNIQLYEDKAIEIPRGKFRRDDRNNDSIC